MTLGMIWAQTPSGVIGNDGTLPWHLPEDLARFKDITQGHPVIMGRSTWESLPAKVRPLPGRTNVVLTRNRDWSDVGATVVHSPVEALRIVGHGDAWVIGGGQVYDALMPYADTLEITTVDVTAPGDAHAPAVGREWGCAAMGLWQTSRSGLRYRYATYTRLDGRRDG